MLAEYKQTCRLGTDGGDKTLSGLTCVSFLYENFKCPMEVDFVKELAFLFNHVVNFKSSW